MGIYSPTASIESTFDDPVLWGRDPNYRADTLGCDRAHSDMHFVIRDISMFRVDDHELSERKLGTVDEAETIDTHRTPSVRPSWRGMLQAA